MSQIITSHILTRKQSYLISISTKRERSVHLEYFFIIYFLTFLFIFLLRVCVCLCTISLIIIDRSALRTHSDRRLEIDRSTFGLAINTYHVSATSEFVGRRGYCIAVDRSDARRRRSAIVRCPPRLDRPADRQEGQTVVPGTALKTTCEQRQTKTVGQSDRCVSHNRRVHK